MEIQREVFDAFFERLNGDLSFSKELIENLRKICNGESITEKIILKLLEESIVD